MSSIQHLDHLDDPRLAPYRNLKDRELARAGGRFIAEGEHVVRRLLDSDFPVESVLMAQRRAEAMAPLAARRAEVYIVPDALVHQIVGFKFHSGILACGRRRPALPLEAAMRHVGPRAVLLICPEIANTENLGGLMRIAAGFGVEAMILGQHCCDPFYRQSIRVSIGAVFRLNLIQSTDLMHDLRRLREEWQVELAGTVLEAGAEPLATARRVRGRLGLLVGNEAQGLPPDLLEACDRRLTIPMRLGTDSLNVTIAAAVCLYHFTMVEPLDSGPGMG